MEILKVLQYTLRKFLSKHSDTSLDDLILIAYVISVTATFS